jgi:hypothetical protein
VQRQVPGQQQSAQERSLSLLEHYANIDLFNLDLKNIVLGHELIGHMSFNDDEKYKALMNEVSYS